MTKLQLWRWGWSRTVPPTGSALRVPVQGSHVPSVSPFLDTLTGWRETTHFQNQPERLYMDIGGKARAVQVRDPQLAELGLA